MPAVPAVPTVPEDSAYPAYPKPGIAVAAIWEGQPAPASGERPEREPPGALGATGAGACTRR
ncbi:MAG: hypothetical protein IPN45_15230 [Actinomycetales bacterium]|nr:hypothetical protein [Actinomycetales bacterium]